MGCAPIFRGSILVATVLGSCAAFADGVCEKGMRDTTAAEQQAMLGAMEAAKAALPLAPEGWVIGGYEELSVRSSTCTDDETTPWPYTFSRTFNRTDDAAAREQALAELQSAVREQQAARQPKLDALIEKQTTLGLAMQAALRDGDQARFDAINREVEQGQREFEGIYNDGGNAANVEAIAQIMEEDRSMSIAVQVNETAHAHGEMQSAPAPAGAQSAHRWTTVENGVETAYELVLFGAWEPNPVGFSPRRRGTASPAVAHAVAVTLQAAPARLDSLRASTDFAGIGRLVR